MQGIINNQTFSTTASDMFDSTAHTQGGFPHLTQQTWDAYVAERLEPAIAARKAKGLPVVTLDEAKKRAPAIDFIKFQAEYLARNRVADSFFVDANYGLRLTNGVMIAVSPGVEIRGTMQDSGAVQVTEGKSQPGQDGMPGSGSLRI